MEDHNLGRREVAQKTEEGGTDGLSFSTRSKLHASGPAAKKYSNEIEALAESGVSCPQVNVGI